VTTAPAATCGEEAIPVNVTAIGGAIGVAVLVPVGAAVNVAVLVPVAVEDAVGAAVLVGVGDGVAVHRTVAVDDGGGSAVMVAIGVVVGLAVAGAARVGSIVATARSVTTVELMDALWARTAAAGKAAVAVVIVVTTTVGSTGCTLGGPGATITDGAMGRMAGDTKGMAVAVTAAAGCATYGSASLSCGSGDAWEASATVGAGWVAGGGVGNVARWSHMLPMPAANTPISPRIRFTPCIRPLDRYLVGYSRAAR
jgi:hypothetical protein